MTKEEAVKLLLEHKQWLEEPPIINGTGRIQKLIEAVQMGAEALDKQIPKKPLIGKYTCRCFNEHNIPVPCRNGKMKYCPMCGQRIDWSEVE